MKSGARSTRKRQRGVSLVELLVGVAIGLIVVAAAAMVVGTQLSENRRLLLETQVQQDLRAAADMVARELRRAGRRELDSGTLQGVWLAEGDTPATSALSDVVVTSGTQVNFKYFRAFGDTNFGFKRDGNSLETHLGGNTDGTWQELTDANTVKVTAFSITERGEPAATPIKIVCPALCADGTSNCWPTMKVRELVVSLTGEPVGNSTMSRTVVSRVRLRNDAPSGVCP